MVFKITVYLNSSKSNITSFQQLNSNLAKIGTYKLIAKTLTTDTPGNWTYKQVDNISVYKYILLAKCDANASFLNSIQVPVSIFKSLNSTKKTLAIEDSGVKMYACYMSDISVGLFCINATYRAELYGIY